MRPIGDRTVIETLPLADCRADDEIDIRYSHNGGWKSIGDGTLVKIKPLPKGGHQIKFRSSWSRSTVQKHDVPAGVAVTRRRAPTAAELAADPSLAPLPERRTVRHDGVDYQSTDRRVAVDEALARAIARQPRQGGLTDRHLALGMGTASLAAASLGIAALLSGGMLRGPDEN